jgi:hypothetical protein
VKHLTGADAVVLGGMILSLLRARLQAQAWSINNSAFTPKSLYSDASSVTERGNTPIVKHPLLQAFCIALPTLQKSVKRSMRPRDLR